MVSKLRFCACGSKWCLCHCGYFADGFGFGTGYQVAVGIHAQRDRAVPHYGLDDLDLRASQSKPGAASVP